MTDAVKALVQEIEEQVERAAVRRGETVSPRLRRENRIRTIHASLSIEQNGLTLEQVTAVLDGIYLIHDNDILRPILWTVLSPNPQYVDFPYIHVLVKVSCVFIGCLAIDLLRRATIGCWFDSLFYAHCDAMIEKLRNVIPKRIQRMFSGIWKNIDINLSMTENDGI